jgi:RNA ligase (TIGR02306 family)
MKLASIEVINNIRNHPNADKLEIAEVLGWQVVVAKGLYNNGDRVVFITIDTIVPRCEWSEFLVNKESPDKPIRIKNIKLRGEYSSGLVIPMIEFPLQFESLDVGDDVTELLGVKKYIKELPANLSGENVGDFPTHIISKTDEDNGLNDPSLVQKVFDSDKFLTITQKIDGSSITIVVNDGQITEVCSRNLSKKETPQSLFWNSAKKLSIPDGWSGIIQGELAGNGIQKNPLKLDGIKVFVFQICVDRKFMTYDEMHDFCKNKLNCDVVPLLTKLDVESTIKMWDNPLHKLQDLADKQTYSGGEIAEGIVVRPANYARSFESRRPLGFKLINRNYKD